MSGIYQLCLLGVTREVCRMGSIAGRLWPSQRHKGKDTGDLLSLNIELGVGSFKFLFHWGGYWLYFQAKGERIWKWWWFFILFPGSNWAQGSPLEELFQGQVDWSEGQWDFLSEDVRQQIDLPLCIYREGCGSNHNSFRSTKTSLQAVDPDKSSWAKTGGEDEWLWGPGLGWERDWGW